MRKRRPIKRGERLFRMGDPLQSVYVTSQGAFKTLTLSESGDEQVLGFHLPGELIGLDGLGDGFHRCEAVALTNVAVCELPYEELGEIARQLPALQQQLFRIIGQGVQRDHDHLAMLVRRQANERIALFLSNINERYARSGNADVQFVLPMSRDDIARYLGLALETVSRGFTRLQEDGVIAVTGRRIEILDANELHRLAQGEAECAQQRAQVR